MALTTHRPATAHGRTTWRGRAASRPTFRLLLGALLLAPALVACGAEESPPADDQCELLDRTSNEQAVDCPEE